MSSNRPTKQRQGPRPLPPGRSLFTQDASPARAAAERRSARPLVYLHQLPAWVPAIVLAALLVTGLALRGPGGAVALCGVAAVLGWLAALSWPRVTTAGRAGRIAMICVIVALAAYQATR